MWIDDLVREHIVIKEALGVLLMAGSSSYILNAGAIIEDILPLYKEFKNIFIDSCHHRKEEILARELGSRGHRPNFDLDKEHALIREAFKEVMARYVSGDRGVGLASSVARYYEAMKRHIEAEEREFFRDALALAPRAGLGEEGVEAIFRRVEEELGGGVHERMEKLVKEMGEILERSVRSLRSTVLNVIEIPPYERHKLIREVISRMKAEGIAGLVLINDHEPVPLYYELLNTEKCFDGDRYFSSKLSEAVWASLIPIIEGCR